MKKINVKCPVCGRINYNLYLEETDGWMECELCGSLTKNAEYMKTFRMPVLQRMDEPKLPCLLGILGEPA